MKTRLLLSFIIIMSVMATGCSRKCCTPGPTTYMQAQKNTSAWFRTEVSAVTITDSLTFIGRGNDDVLSMKIKYTGVGKYPLTGLQAHYTIIVGGDVTGVEYIVDNTKENFVNIKYYDTAAGIIVGDFTLNLLKGLRYSAADNTYPVTATFTNGTFQMQLAK